VGLTTANHEPPTYANLSPADALALAADLTALAKDALADEFRASAKAAGASEGE
jgi:hypothetical protein